jgi:hypothetical protein
LQVGAELKHDGIAVDIAFLGGVGFKRSGLVTQLGSEL